MVPYLLDDDFQGLLFMMLNLLQAVEVCEGMCDLKNYLSKSDFTCQLCLQCAINAEEVHISELVYIWTSIIEIFPDTLTLWAVYLHTSKQNEICRPSPHLPSLTKASF